MTSFSPLRPLALSIATMLLGAGSAFGKPAMDEHVTKLVRFVEQHGNFSTKGKEGDENLTNILIVEGKKISLVAWLRAKNSAGIVTSIYRKYTFDLARMDPNRSSQYTTRSPLGEPHQSHQVIIYCRKEPRCVSLSVRYSGTLARRAARNPAPGREHWPKPTDWNTAKWHRVDFYFRTRDHAVRFQGLMRTAVRAAQGSTK